jgi:hypothetical protein
MPTPARVPNPRGEMIGPPEVSASDAENGFGRILERVAREGGVARSPDITFTGSSLADQSCLILTRPLRPTRGAQSLLSNMFDTILRMR